VLLAITGLYGLVSQAVSQRAPEIGLRLAVGASPGDVERMILRQGAGLAVQGTALGACLVVAMRPLIPGLPRAAVITPAMIAVAVSLLIAVVLIAAWLPARRAARIDPTLALRAE
jgi:putative ABC transport system permease protein